MFSKTRQHLKCNLLFGLRGHFGLLKNVNISFFLSFEGTTSRPALISSSREGVGDYSCLFMCMNSPTYFSLQTPLCIMTFFIFTTSLWLYHAWMPCQLWCLEKHLWRHNEIAPIVWLPLEIVKSLSLVEGIQISSINQPCLYLLWAHCCILLLGYNSIYILSTYIELKIFYYGGYNSIRGLQCKY